MISPRPTLSSGFFAFRPGGASSSSPTVSPPPSPRPHAPPPLSASFSPSAAAVAPTEHAARSSSSFYDVLGLRPGASAPEIKAAYRRLARAVHPDAAAAAPHATAEDFIRVHAAYSTLSDPDKRADYDRHLFLSSVSAAGGGGGGPAFGRSPSFPARRPRTWETDQCW